MSITRRFGVLTAVIAAVAFIAVVQQPPQTAYAAGPTINGGGSSFAALEIDQWRAEVARKPFELSVNYASQGSSFGRQQYMAGALDFAASDIPFQESEKATLQASGRADFVYVPVSAGGLAFMYNLVDSGGNQVRDLKLTRRAVCRMFTEPDMKWSDPDITSANPGLSLTDDFIRPILREDGSGTSFVFSQFCQVVVPDIWQAFVDRLSSSVFDQDFLAGRPVSKWPSGWGKGSTAQSALGVAQAVADPTGRFSITYNEAGFAKLYSAPDGQPFPNASVENANPGVFTDPTEDAVSTALGYAEPAGNGTFILNFTGPDATAYFPSTYSYIIAQTTGFPADKGEALARFLCYAVTKGQRVELTKQLGYARLSAPLVDIARDGISKIPGAPPWEQCRVESAPPPPAPPTAGGGGGSAGGGGGGGGGGGATPGAGTTPGGGATPAGGSTPAAGGGARPTNGSVVIDPVTGSSIVVGDDAGAADGECLDPETGLPADPSLCADVDSGALSGGQGGQGGVAGSGGQAARPAAKNAEVLEDSGGPSGSQIAWWLMQGASVCAIGVSLAGVRRRLT
jgi:phosphate transport system substrate-binding protein